MTAETDSGGGGGTGDATATLTKPDRSVVRGTYVDGDTTRIDFDSDGNVTDFDDFHDRDT